MSRHRIERVRDDEFGWDVTCATTGIATRARCESMMLALGAKSFPEMVYDSALTLKHEDSGVTLTFDAERALGAMVEAKGRGVKVAHAETWTRAHAERFGDVDQRAIAEDDSSANEERGEKVRASASSAGWHSRETTESYDWTFTTPYGGTASADERTGKPCPTWEPTTRRIDRDMLTERDPIRLYDEITLYESELDDNGVAHLGVKVRVMPKCWYVLLRFWLRVDGVCLRLRETRFFCDITRRDELGAVIIVRETTSREETWAELRARGAPVDPREYPDADAAALVLASAARAPIVEFHELRLA